MSPYNNAITREQLATSLRIVQETDRSFPAVTGTPNGFQDWTQDDQTIYIEARALEIPFSQLWKAKWEARTLPGQDRSLFSLLKVVV